MLAYWLSSVALLMYYFEEELSMRFAEIEGEQPEAATHLQDNLDRVLLSVLPCSTLLSVSLALTVVTSFSYHCVLP